MIPDVIDMRLLRAIADGLPLVSRPYASVAAWARIGEDEVIRRLRRLIEGGIVKRLGVIVRHCELGYHANAMVVWDVPDGEVAKIGRRLATYPFVTLCYQRRRRLPEWPYNLFCMIHGKDRATVEGQIASLNAEIGLARYRQATLFSRRCFKQRGARFDRSAAPAREVA